jgi:hypothetical protein
MAHKTGFTQRTLAEYLVQNGFAQASVMRQPEHYSLTAMGYREAHPEVAAQMENATKSETAAKSDTLDFPFE